MAKNTAFRASILDLIFLNSNIANVGDATGIRGSSVAGSLYLTLHTADPGAAGTVATNAATYGDYAPVAVARSGAGFSRTGNVITNVARVDWPAGTSGAPAANITHVGIAVSSAGATPLLAVATLGTAMVSGNNVTPYLPAGTGFTWTET